MNEWPSDWLRAVLSLAVLSVLRAGSAHGYAIAARLEAGGLGEIKGGTLYPLLGRLERAGMVRSRWQPGAGGPGRKVFTLTESGAEHLAADAAKWHRFVVQVAHVVNASIEGESHV